jgi:hypothetical protein
MFLALSLFMLRVLANNTHPAFTADGFAVFTDFFYRSSNFHTV